MFKSIIHKLYNQLLNRSLSIAFAIIFNVNKPIKKNKNLSNLCFITKQYVNQSIKNNINKILITYLKYKSQPKKTRKLLLPYKAKKENSSTHRLITMLNKITRNYKIYLIRKKYIIKKIMSPEYVMLNKIYKNSIDVNYKNRIKRAYNNYMQRKNLGYKARVKIDPYRVTKMNYLDSFNLLVLIKIQKAIRFYLDFTNKKKLIENRFYSKNIRMKDNINVYQLFNIQSNSIKRSTYEYKSTLNKINSSTVAKNNKNKYNDIDLNYATDFLNNVKNSFRLKLLSNAFESIKNYERKIKIKPLNNTNYIYMKKSYSMKSIINKIVLIQTSVREYLVYKLKFITTPKLLPTIINKEYKYNLNSLYYLQFAIKRFIKKINLDKLQRKINIYTRSVFFYNYLSNIYSDVYKNHVNQSFIEMIQYNKNKIYLKKNYPTTIPLFYKHTINQILHKKTKQIQSHYLNYIKSKKPILKKPTSKTPIITKSLINSNNYFLHYSQN